MLEAETVGEQRELVCGEGVRFQGYQAVNGLALVVEVFGDSWAYNHS